MGRRSRREKKHLEKSGEPTTPEEQKTSETSEKQEPIIEVTHPPPSTADHYQTNYNIDLFTNTIRTPEAGKGSGVKSDYSTTKVGKLEEVPMGGSTPVRPPSSAAGTPSSTVDTDKTKRIQEKVTDVTRVMEKNVQDAMQRGERLEDLEAKTGTFPVIINFLRGITRRCQTVFQKCIASASQLVVEKHENSYLYSGYHLDNSILHWRLYSFFNVKR